MRVLIAKQTCVLRTRYLLVQAKGVTILTPRGNSLGDPLTHDCSSKGGFWKFDLHSKHIILYEIIVIMTHVDVGLRNSITFKSNTHGQLRQLHGL
ncbi:hypothetical protein SLA2020_161830 [Shorea laevis]